MSDQPIKIGILGCGGYGCTARSYLNNTGEFDIVACMDVDRGVAERVAAKESATAYADLSAFLDHPEMEAVCINTPVLLHAEHSLRCLAAGKHVFITKPVTAFVEEAQEVAEHAKGRSLVYMVGHHGRHSAISRLVEGILASGRLGRVCNVSVTCCSSGGLAQHAGNWRVLPGKNPGGPLLQCGIHTIDLLLELFGPIKRVLAVTQDDVTPFGVVDNALTLLDFANGTQVAFVCNYTTAYMHTMHFFGTKGNLHVQKHITGLGQEQVYIQPRGAGDHEPWQALAIQRDKSFPDDHGGILEKSFAAQIRSAKPCYDNLEAAIEALRIVHAAIASAGSGRSVEVSAGRRRAEGPEGNDP